MTTVVEIGEFKILYEYLDPRENCENIKCHEPTKDEEDRSDILSSPAFLSPTPKPALTSFCFFFNHGQDLVHH